MMHNLPSASLLTGGGRCTSRYGVGVERAKQRRKELCFHCRSQPGVLRGAWLSQVGVSAMQMQVARSAASQPAPALVLAPPPRALPLLLRCSLPIRLLRSACQTSLAPAHAAFSIMIHAPAADAHKPPSSPSRPQSRRQTVHAASDSSRIPIPVFVCPKMAPSICARHGHGPICNYILPASRALVWLRDGMRWADPRPR